ncbi:MAG: TlyA family RNA methyltransferase, partial [Coriobacteriales bacterium]|nr:TlyA family RNA methyltransferase [Coriobacteriales bacterium]
CADLGCSTGGFTQCLLQSGAKSVSAVDVGYGQFDYSLRQNPKVKLFERTNVRNVDADEIGGPFDLVVGDLSFISLCVVLPKVSQFLKKSAESVLLIKPQFELDSTYIDEGGIVTNLDYHLLAINAVLECASENGFEILGLTRSSIKGAKGNIEYLAHLQNDDNACLKHPSFDEKQISAIVKGSL